MTCDTAPLISSPVQPQETTICVALELSRSTWLVGINLPGSEKISKHIVPGGDGAALLALLAKIVTAQVWATSGGFQPGDQDG